MFYCYMPVFPISFYNFPWIYSHDSHVDAKHFTRYTRNNRSIHYTVNTNQILLLRHIKGWNNNSEPTIHVCVSSKGVFSLTKLNIYRYSHTNAPATMYICTHVHVFIHTSTVSAEILFPYWTYMCVYSTHTMHTSAVSVRIIQTLMFRITCCYSQYTNKLFHKKQKKKE